MLLKHFLIVTSRNADDVSQAENKCTATDVKFSQNPTKLQLHSKREARNRTISSFSSSRVSGVFFFNVFRHVTKPLSTVSYNRHNKTAASSIRVCDDMAPDVTEHVISTGVRRHRVRRHHISSPLSRRRT